MRSLKNLRSISAYQLILWLFGAACCFVWVTSEGARVLARVQDHDAGSPRYKTYRNDHYNFSAEYPAEWHLTEALDGNAVAISPSPSGRSRISIDGRKVMTKDAHVLSLDEDFDDSLQSMQRKHAAPGHHPDHVVLVNKRRTTLVGLPAIVSRIEFEQDGKHWIELGLMIHSKDGDIAYDISADCHPNELPDFQPIYDKLVQTFHILGPPR